MDVKNKALTDTGIRALHGRRLPTRPQKQMNSGYTPPPTRTCRLPRRLLHTWRIKSVTSSWPDDTVSAKNPQWTVRGAYGSARRTAKRILPIANRPRATSLHATFKFPAGDEASLLGASIFMTPKPANLRQLTSDSDRGQKILDQRKGLVVS